MDTIFMNSENSKTPDRYVALSNLNIYYTSEV